MTRQLLTSLLALSLVGCTAGERGPQGDVGPQGSAGPKGDQGDVGDKGDKGDLGPEGAEGAPGAVGPVGPAGVQGAVGPQGAQGQPGPAGADGSPDTGQDILTKLAAACPDPNAVANFGFCIWHIPGYTKTYKQAAAACKASQARLCTRAELSAAQAAGAEWCSNGWLADRSANTTAYQGYPMQTVVNGCGSSVGVIENNAAMTEQVAANCCRP